MSQPPCMPHVEPSIHDHWPLPKKTIATTLLIIIVVVVAIVAALRLWQVGPFGSAVEMTDNAYVHGLTTIVSPQVSGYVTQVTVTDYDKVAEGQVLVRIDDSTYQAQVDQAKAILDVQLAAQQNLDQEYASRQAARRGDAAAIESAKAQLLRAKSDMARVDDLVSDGSVSIREQDQLRATLAQSTAQLSQSQAAYDIAVEAIRTVEVNRASVSAQIESARATLRKASIDLGNTVIRAPKGGRLGEVGVHLGQYVTNGTQLLPLVPDGRWVIANFKETQTYAMKPGQKAWISVDALNGKRFDGHVELIAPAAGSEFSVIKPDNGTGNFVKIPQRIGIRISLDASPDELAMLRPGMSVEANVDTGHVR